MEDEARYLFRVSTTFFFEECVGGGCEVGIWEGIDDDRDGKKSRLIGNRGGIDSINGKVI
jgi:hypothetical protein